MLIVAATRWPVAPEPVSQDRRSGFDVGQQELSDCGGVDLLDHLHAAAPDAVIALLHSDLHDRLVCRAAATTARRWSSEHRLVDLDDTSQPLTSRAHHRCPVAVQHRPRSLLGPDREGPLETQCGDPMLLADHHPGRREPHCQRRTRSVKDRVRRSGHTTTTAPTGPAAIIKLPRLLAATDRTAKPLRPAQPVEIVQTGCVSREPRTQRSIRAGIVHANPWRITRDRLRLLHQDGGPILTITPAPGRGSLSLGCGCSSTMATGR